VRFRNSGITSRFFIAAQFRTARTVRFVALAAEPSAIEFKCAEPPAAFAGLLFAELNFRTHDWASFHSRAHGGNGDP
jgi:hypothetical protein